MPRLGNQFLLMVIAALALLGFVNSEDHALASTKDARQQGIRTFIVAASDNFPPVNMLDKDGDLGGFGRELSSAVIRAVGGQASYLHSPRWTEVLDYLQTGRADFLHDTAYSADRDLFLDFSDPILEMKEVIVVRPEQHDITGFESLKGKAVACVNKHITHLYLGQFPEIRCHVVRTPAEAVYSLIAGDVDAFVYPEQIVAYLSQELRLGDKLKVTGEPLRILKWSMAVREGDTELLDLLNAGIRKVRQSGEYERIYTKWFGKRILAGYTRKEIRFFGFIALLLSVASGSSIGLLILFTRLRSSTNSLSRSIAERKKAEDVVRQSHERLRRFVDANIIGVIIASPSGVVVEANDYYLRMIGYTREEFERGLVDWRATTPPEWLPTDERAIAELRERGTCTPYEKEYLRRDGTRVWVFLSDTMLPGPEEQIAAFALDITERKQAEENLRKLTVELEQRVLERTFDLEHRGAELDESRRALVNLVEDLNRKSDELARANARLQELDRLKSMFVASMSHELRTPLNSIIGFTGIILQGLAGEITAEQRKQLGLVQGSARHLLALINDIIDISKIEAGKVELTAKEFDLADLVREAVRSFETLAAEKGLRLACEGPEQLPVVGDERRVRQVVLNLVGNALKFTEQGEVSIRLAVEAGRAAIAVRDSGPGIRPEDRELLFKAFSRIPAGNRTIKEGTGLGLYLSTRIAELLGGRIECESEYGKGSTFTFRLPLRQA